MDLSDIPGYHQGGHLLLPGLTSTGVSLGNSTSVACATVTTGVAGVAADNASGADDTTGGQGLKRTSSQMTDMTDRTGYDSEAEAEADCTPGGRLEEGSVQCPVCLELIRDFGNDPDRRLIFLSCCSDTDDSCCYVCRQCLGMHLRTNGR